MSKEYELDVIEVRRYQVYVDADNKRQAEDIFKGSPRQAVEKYNDTALSTVIANNTLIGS